MAISWLPSPRTAGARNRQPGHDSWFRVGRPAASPGCTRPPSARVLARAGERLGAEGALGNHPGSRLVPPGDTVAVAATRETTRCLPNDMFAGTGQTGRAADIAALNEAPIINIMLSYGSSRA